MKYLLIGCVCFELGLVTDKADKVEVKVIKAKVQQVVQNPHCHTGRMK